MEDKPVQRPAGSHGLQRLILCCRAGRSFALGVLMVALPLALRTKGLDSRGINYSLAAGLAGAVAGMQLGRPASRHLGRVGALALSTAVMGIAAALVVLVSNLLGLLLVLFVGAMSVQPNISVQAPLEHATLASSVDNSTDRSHLFAWYNSLSTIALAGGSFASGFLPFGPEGQVLVASLLLLGAASAYLVFSLSTGSSAPKSTSDPLLVKEDKALSDCPHWQRILGMASLFAVDAFAGGIALNSIIVHWLSLFYDVPETILGTLFGVCNIVTTPSLWVAVWLGKRIGLINTMVFTHLPSNMCLILMPFMEDVQSIYVLLLIRAGLGQMDVPARESFMMGVVGEEERITCSSVITTSRALASIAGPPTCALLWGMWGPTVPMVVSGTLKCVYDLSLLVTFRTLRTV